MARIASLVWLLYSANAVGAIIVAEGETFSTLGTIGTNGWRATHQDDSYASHTYGGMWTVNGGCLGAPASSVDAIATQTVTVTQAGLYRVWSKYQAPPYFNYLHRIEIEQAGTTKFTYVYGKVDAPRFWSFSAAYGMINECWWPWGVDHDAAEAPTNTVQLSVGTATIRLITITNSVPAGDRMVDFVLLTTDQANQYQGWQPYGVASPFCLEAIEATKFYMRFRNTAASPAQLQVSRAGHFQPNYAGATTNLPVSAVAAGQWSSWFNIGPFCRLVHNEGLTLYLPGAPGTYAVEFARSADGQNSAGSVVVSNNDVVNVPMDVVWDTNAVVRRSQDLATSLIASTNIWRTANKGVKPSHLLFYGTFGGGGGWRDALKDALGYNTQLPAPYAHVQRDGIYYHAHDESQITSLASSLTTQQKQDFQVLSFGDEISLGEIDFNSGANLTKFHAWLSSNNVTTVDLGGVPPASAALTKTGSPREVWYSNLFNEEERFGAFRSMTTLAKQQISTNVLCGANYSPHTLALCYGPVYKWVDIFRHNGMNMFWTEDYIFSIPEIPQTISWMFATIRCGVKYNKQPIHFYMMPHAPGQLPSVFRRNTLLGVGNGASHINNFWVAPQEQFTENYISWGYDEMFRAAHEAIYDTAEAEPYQWGGTVRPASVAVVISKATDFNESRVMIPRSNDVFASRCANADANLNQIICRKDQQMLYLALRQSGHAVDLITEEDIVEGVLTNYDVAYFAGEWIDNHTIAPLNSWVQSGGVLYAAAGCGRFNQYGESEPAMNQLLGISGSTVEKNVAIIRTLLELPIMPAIGVITMGADTIQAIGMRQKFTVTTAQVLGRWEDGSAAVTMRTNGLGKVFAVGTLAGNTYMKTGLRPEPWARGGRKMVYNPVSFDPAAAALVRLGVDAAPVEENVLCSNPLVEASVIDTTNGTLVTLINWTNAKLTNLTVTVKLSAAPKSVKSVAQQKLLLTSYANGSVTFATDLEDADYFLLPKKTVGDPPFSYVPAKAFHVLPGTHNMESGYFSLCEGLNGNIYIGTAKYGEDGYLVEFNPRTETQRVVIDVMSLCGLTGTDFVAQAKIHTRNSVGPSGRIYVGSKQGIQGANNWQVYPGGYLMSYDPVSGTATNYGMPMAHEGIIDVVADESRNLIYIVTCVDDSAHAIQRWMTYNMQTHVFAEIGPLGFSYATTLVDIQGRANLLTTNFSLAQYNPDTQAVQQRPIKVDGVTLAPASGNSIPTWNLSPDKRFAYLILMDDPTLIKIDLMSTGAFVNAHSYGPMLAGVAPDSRSAMIVAPDGTVYAVIKVNNTTGYYKNAGNNFLHHLVCFNPQTGLMTDLGVLAIQNKDYYTFAMGGPNATPQWAHGVEELPDGTYTPRWNHMALIRAADGTLYVTIIYPFTLLKIDPAVLHPPETLVATSSGAGSLTPIGTMEHRGSRTFIAMAAAYHHVSGIVTNGTPSAGPFDKTDSSRAFTWHGAGNGTVNVMFEENLATNEVPEWWLAANGFTNGTFDAMALTDSDLDGQLNWEEYITGMNPMSSNSVFGIFEIARSGDGHIFVRWPSVSNRLYDVESFTNLLDGLPRQLTNNLGGRPAFTTYTDTFSNVKSGFYRVRVKK